MTVTSAPPKSASLIGCLGQALFPLFNWVIVAHPGQIKIDFYGNKVWIEGPTTKKEKATFDGFIQNKREHEDELGMLTDDLKNADSESNKEIIQSEIDHVTMVLGVLHKVIRRMSS